MDDLNTEHAGRFGRLRKEISEPINCTRLALMIKLSSQLILIKVNNTRGVTLMQKRRLLHESHAKADSTLQVPDI